MESFDMWLWSVDLPCFLSFIHKNVVVISHFSFSIIPEISAIMLPVFRSLTACDLQTRFQKSWDTVQIVKKKGMR